MATRRQHTLPDQDIDEIRECILSEADGQGLVAEGDLFVDPYFPPDQSSLNFVYSGDDKYERMVFKRPRDLCVSPNLCGVGGVCNIKLPWRQWNDRHWFLYALAVVSMNPAYMAKLLPGHAVFEQGFSKSYCGAFLIQLWRFGEWVEVVVDDFLPFLDGALAYCPIFGTPPELWGALVEKAYAKCHRVYEAVEMGNTLNALTDLTGAVCEHYSTERANSRLFYITYKSCVNRSLVTCWRHVRSLKEQGFLPSPLPTKGKNVLTNEQEDTVENTFNQVLMVTAATKFPMRDGSMLEVVRLKDPYDKLYNTWSGDFSEGHASWNRVNPAFLENYRPKESREPTEFWMSFADFCVHFGDVIVCSSSQPYPGIQFECERKYKGIAMDDFTSLEAMPYFCGIGDQSLDSSKAKCSVSESRTTTHISAGPLTASLKKRGKKKNIEITVEEGRNTIKVDTVSSGSKEDHHVSSALRRKCKGSEAKYRTTGGRNGLEEAGHQQVFQKPSRPEFASLVLEDAVFLSRSTPSPSLPACSRFSEWDRCSFSGNDPGSSFSGSGRINNYALRGVESSFSFDSNISHLSGISSGTNESGISATCMSDVKINFHNQPQAQSNPVVRASSAPLARRKCSNRSTSSQTSMFESRMDYFRSRGSWNEIVMYTGKWKKSTSGGPRVHVQSHSKNPRVPISVGKGDAVNEITPGGLHGKAHILVSLLQDYRQGSRTINGMRVNIGVCLYKAKNLDRDEKRTLSNLTLVDDITSEGESREVTARFDVEPGLYFLVPYTSEPGQTGEFLLRVLGEKDEVSGKTACVIS